MFTMKSILMAAIASLILLPLFLTKVSSTSATNLPTTNTLTQAEQPPTALVGEAGYALVFDGVDDYVEVTDFPVSETFTAEMWVNPYSTNDEQMFLAKHTSNGDNIFFVGYKAGSLRVRVRSDAHDEGSKITGYHHLAVVVEKTSSSSSDVTVYRNGALLWQHTLSDVLGNTTGRAWVLGQDWDGDVLTDFFNGAIDELRIWNVARTPEEIAAEMNRRLAGNESGLVGYWRLDKGFGTTALDASGNGEDGTIDGATWAVSDAPIGAVASVDGAGSALGFDGVNDYASIPDDDSIDFPRDQDFTVAAWILASSQQQNTLNGDNDVIEKWTGSSGYPYVIRYLNQSHSHYGKIVAARYDGTNFPSILSTRTINDGKFHHVAFVKSGETLVLYIDGTLQGTTTDTTTGETTNSSPLFISRRGDNINYFTGQVDELRIWNIARTQEQIAAEMNRALSGSESGLVGYWRFDEGTGSSAADASGNGHNGTVNGASWVASDAPISALQATDIRWHEVTGNGNGLIDPGESIALEVDVSSGLDATNISGTLAVTGGSVTLSNDSSSYPDLVAGATVSNSTPYAFVVDPSCTGDLTFTLTVTYNTNQTTQTAILPLIIPAGLAFGEQHAYTGSAIAIPDDNATGAIASIEIATGGRVADVDVHVEASHPYDADLDLYLIAPSGTIVELSSENGGDGDDYSGTIFDDDASTPISSGSAPFTGRFQPEEALTLLNGEPVSGTWQLKVVDDTFGGEGTLTGFALDIQTVSYLCLAASADSPTILGSPTLFTASARLPVAAIEWDFADGSPSVISTLPLSHTYAAVGNYSASATAFLFGQPGTTVDMEVSIVPTTTDVRITNLRDASLTISWLTDLATSGEVHYGTNPSNLNQTVQDERGASTSDDTHFVTLLSLLPNTTYYFDVLSAGVTDDNHGSHYTVTTAPTLELPGNDQIYGQVFLTDTTPAAGTIVYITLEDKNSVGTPSEAAPLSALVDESGYWFFNLADARTTDLSSYFSYSSSGDRLRLEAKGAGDGRGCQIVDTSVDSPAEAIVLSLSPCTTTWEIDLDASWNHISLPLAPLVAYSAESVCDEIDAQGGNTAEIDRWHNGGWDGHICQLTFNDYPLALASSDFIKSNTPTTWIIEGVEVSVPVPLDIQVGWNSIGIPHPDAYSAESLCQEIIDQGVTAVEIDRWYASGWSGHICGLPFNDFNIERGVGYFVKASSAGSVIPSEPATSLQQLVQAEERGADVLPTLPTGPSLPVQDWQLGNLRDTSVTFSWLTEAATTGYLRFGEVADQLDQVATDSRGADMSRTTHVVVLNHLEPETTYHFEIISGQEVAERGSFTTAPSMESVPESDTIYGRVYQADGERPASGALVYLTLRDADGEGSRSEAALLLATVDASGYWQANLGNARTSDLSGSFSYAATDVVVMTAQGRGHETASQTVELANTPQAPDLILQSSPTAVTLNDLSSDLPVSSKWLLTLAALTLLAGVLLARRIK